MLRRKLEKKKFEEKRVHGERPVAMDASLGTTWRHQSTGLDVHDT